MLFTLFLNRHCILSLEMLAGHCIISWTNHVKDLLTVSGVSSHDTHITEFWNWSLQYARIGVSHFIFLQMPYPKCLQPGRLNWSATGATPRPNHPPWLSTRDSSSCKSVPGVQHDSLLRLFPDYCSAEMYMAQDLCHPWPCATDFCWPFSVISIGSFYHQGP